VLFSPEAHVIVTYEKISQLMHMEGGALL